MATSNDTPKPNDYLLQLDTLSREREAVWSRSNEAYRLEDKRHDTEREKLKQSERNEMAAVDKALSELYADATGATELSAGMVVKAIRSYGDLKENECGFVKSLSYDIDHDVQQITLVVDGGVITVARDIVVLVIDLDEADLFRFKMLTHYIHFSEGVSLLRTLKSTQALLGGWIARLEGDQS